MKPAYLGIEDLLDLVDPPNREVCRRILGDNRRLFEAVQGASHNHQAWPGGYLDHVTDAMNVATVLYGSLGALRPLPFALSDALLVLYLHDLEKPWKYEMGPDGGLRYREGLKTKADARAFRERKFAEYGVALTAEQANGL